MINKFPSASKPDEVIAFADAMITGLDATNFSSNNPQILSDALSMYQARMTQVEASVRVKDDAKDAYAKLIATMKYQLAIATSTNLAATPTAIGWAGNEYKYAAPSAPAAVVVTTEGQSAGSAFVNWEKVSGADLYVIRVDGDFVGAVVQSEILLTGLPAGAHMVSVVCQGLIGSSGPVTVTFNIT